MGRFLSHRGHVLLPVGEGYVVPDYMHPDELPVGPVQAKKLIDEKEKAGAPVLSPRSVTWDAPISAVSPVALAVFVGQAASTIGAGRGETVRVTLEKLERRPCSG